MLDDFIYVTAGIWHDKDYNNHSNKGNGNASPFSGALLELLGNLKLVGPSPDKRICMSNMTLNIIQLVPLCFNQCCHVKENLVKIHQECLTLTCRYQLVDRLLVCLLPCYSVVSPAYRFLVF